MATNWHGYWDRLPGGIAVYTASMLIPPMSMARLKDKTPTTFLLFSKHPRKPLKAWTGTITDIDALDRKVVFRVRLRREVKFPRRHKDLPDGWHILDPGPTGPATGIW